MDIVPTKVGSSGLRACAVSGYKPTKPLKLVTRTNTTAALALRQRLHPLHTMKKAFYESRVKLPSFRVNP